LAPEILTFQAKSVVGFRFDMSIEKNNSIEMWEKLNTKLAKQNDILTYNNRYSIYETGNTCLSNTFSKNSETTVFIGIETPGDTNIPNGMQLKEITGGKYAKFIKKGTVKYSMVTKRQISICIGA